MMRQYEIAVAVKPTKTAGEHPIVKRMSSWLAKDSQVKVLDTWEKYALAYPIKKQNEAHFLFIEAVVDAAEVGPLNDHLQHDEEVLRHLFIRGSKKLKAKAIKAPKETKVPEETKEKAKTTRKKNTSS